MNRQLAPEDVKHDEDHGPRIVHVFRGGSEVALCGSPRAPAYVSRLCSRPPQGCVVCQNLRGDRPARPLWRLVG